MKVVGNYWESQLKEALRPKDSFKHFDIESSSLFEPTQTWVLAGLDSLKIKKASVVNWMQLDVYKTREKLLQIRKIRQTVLLKLFLANPNLTQIIDDVKMKTTLILDPKSKLLPQAVTDNWTLTTHDVYSICREMCYNIHKKREKFYKQDDKS